MWWAEMKVFALGAGGGGVVLLDFSFRMCWADEVFGLGAGGGGSLRQLQEI